MHRRVRIFGAVVLGLAWQAGAAWAAEEVKLEKGVMKVHGTVVFVDTEENTVKLHPDGSTGRPEVYTLTNETDVLEKRPIESIAGLMPGREVTIAFEQGGGRPVAKAIVLDMRNPAHAKAQSPADASLARQPAPSSSTEPPRVRAQQKSRSGEGMSAREWDHTEE
jgi:hypothetical protein